MPGQVAVLVNSAPSPGNTTVSPLRCRPTSAKPRCFTMNAVARTDATIHCLPACMYMPVCASMYSGVALVTNFSLRATGWTDPEADLPLTYAYYASNILLAADSASASLHVCRRQHLPRCDWSPCVAYCAALIH